MASAEPLPPASPRQLTLPPVAKDLTVIIVNWNAAEYLPAALDALFAAQGDLSMETLLVDNASSDDSLRLVRENYPQVQIIANQANLGFAAGNNQGIRRARGRYILLLNPDTEIPPHALSRFVSYMDAHPQTGVAGPRLQGPKGKIQGGAAGHDPSFVTIFNFATFLYRLFPGKFRGLWLTRALYEGVDPIPVDWVSGACMMLRREAILAAGEMNERYFMYSEDVELCRRIREQGWGIVCLPGIRVTHHIGGSSSQLGPEFYAHNIDSMDLDLRTRYNAVQVALMHLIAAFGYGMRMAFYEFHYRRTHFPVLRDLSALWRACLTTSLRRMVHPAPVVTSYGKDKLPASDRHERQHAGEG